MSESPTIFVSRPSHWGNPYVLGMKCQRCGQLHMEPGSTILCFELYAKAKLAEDPTWLEPLFGKKLRCAGCASDATTCHARVLERLMECPECNNTGRVEMYPGSFADGNYYRKCDACGRTDQDGWPTSGAKLP